MMGSTPSTTKVSNVPVDAEFVPPPSGAEQVKSSQGVGDGWGSAPGDSPGPASAESETTQMSVRAIKSFLNGVPPSVTVRTEIARKLTEDSTTFVCPASDEADGLEESRALFVRLYREGRLDEAHALCSDRTASLDPSDCEGRVVWACNFAMLCRDAEDFGLARALLTMVAPFVSECPYLTRAKYHNGLGRTLELMGHLPEAIAEYERAAPLFAFGGHVGEVAKPLLNIGRVKASGGKVDEARMYLDRAARIAIDAGDYRLLGEIAEEGAKL